jgi:hypothetical protein
MGRIDDVIANREIVTVLAHRDTFLKIWAALQADRSLTFAPSDKATLSTKGRGGIVVFGLK